MDRILVRMMSPFGDAVRNVVDRDDGVEEHHHDEYQ
jgi:hypothetical protein